MESCWHGTTVMMTRCNSCKAPFWSVWLACFLFGPVSPARADFTWLYTVQISATAQISPPTITLRWPQDPYGADSYTVYRKGRDDYSWGDPIASLPGSATAFTDSNVQAGAAYEYQITKAASLGYKGYGYIYAGINAPMIEARGKLILVVASNIAGSLAAELERLQNDLIGDGWQVIRHDVSVSDTPDNVRNFIMADFYADPANVNTVFLFGHVPILQSGNLDYDSHGARAMPADGFYADMNNDWPTAPGSTPSFIPSPVKLMVGRADMYDLPGIGASPSWPNETELLRAYLNKDHNWRFKLIPVQRRALMANRLGDINGIAPAASGYRNFEPFVGPGNTIEANTADDAPDTQRWISMVTAATWLWTFACGGGTDTSISHCGLHASYFNVWSTDIVDQGMKAIFVMFDGSHFANWDHTDDILRAPLAAPTYGLACCLAGGPHWFLHHMGLGETIGFGTRLTMNNDGFYQNDSNYLARAVYIGLMGDPSLRMEPILPPAAFNGSSSGGQVTLNWPASPDASAGYHVYRSVSPNGPFTRISGNFVTDPSFTDNPGPGTYTYMVRAVALQTNPSGSYYNPSQGVFVTLNVNGTAVPPIQLSVSQTGNAIELTWNSAAGVMYHVEARTDAHQGSWSNISGSMTANGPSMRWTDTSAHLYSTQFYRVSSP
jgi:hypothetical protein